MKSKVYYGEYTLEHWLNLMLTNSIELPEYQRHFAWEKKNLHELIKTLKNEIYVPPITIGAYKDASGNIHNFILDGQQRLTSILLAYLGLFPRKENFVEKEVDLYEDGAETEVLMEDSDEKLVPIPWKYTMLMDRIKSNEGMPLLNKSDIINILKTTEDYSKYESIVGEDIIDETFLQKTYLGFSYIVPIFEQPQDQQKFYSSVFRGMNRSGIRLSGLESRRALYYLNIKLVGFFEPPACTQIKVLVKSKSTQYDFVRALSFLAEYKARGGVANIAKGCSRQENLEQYYEDYIHAVVYNEDSIKFGQFTRDIPKDQIEARLLAMSQAIERLQLKRKMSTIIEADLYLFGLIYTTIYEGKTIDDSKCVAIQSSVTKGVDDVKTSVPNHARTPNALKYLRERISKSIHIYKSLS